jgi:hypothetical protein
MANDCDSDAIIIEDSIRAKFFDYLDSNARSLIFRNVVDNWA